MADYGPHHPERRILNALRLPSFIVESIKNGTLVAEVEQARSMIAGYNEQLDAWEAKNPNAASLLPWYEARKAWKDAGSPQPDWWELLWMLQNRHMPIRSQEISKNLLCQYRRPWDAPGPYGSGRPTPTRNGDYTPWKHLKPST